MSEKMMMKVWPWVLVVLLLAGCGKKDPAAGSVAQGGDAPAVTGEAEQPELTPEDIERQANALESEMSGLFPIKDGAELGYEPADTPVTRSLGERIDAALATLEPSLVKARFDMDNGGELTTARPIVRLKDKDTYAIEYVLIDNPQEIGRLVARDGKEVQFRQSEFGKSSLPNPPARIGKDELDVWLRDFPVRMFDGYRTGDKTWTKVVAALNDPKNGYRTRTEEGKQKVNDEERPYYRILAERTDGKGELEIVVDSKLYLPVTLRSRTVRGDGKERKMFWTASWQFGGQFEENAFVAPGL